MITNLAQIAAVVEDEEGTAEALTAADVVLAGNIKFTPNDEFNERPAAGASFSPHAGVPGIRSATIEFDVSIAGSGTAGTAPSYGVLLQGCACAVTPTPTETPTSVVITPGSASIPSLTLGFYEDGKLKTLRGCRGDVNFIFETGKGGIMHFVFTAADYVDTDAALLTGVTYGDEVPPAFMAAGLTIDSYAALIGKLEIRSQNKIALRPDMNSTSGHKSAVITGRRPVMTFDPEETLVATYAFYTKLRTAGNLTAGLEFTIGATAGNIIAVAAGAVQYMKVNPADVNGWRTLGIDCALNRTSGDDEWTITLT